ncbi:PP2C family protein-serine/threonine phosphatase [Streptomyces sp. NPDC020096]
MWTRGFRKAIDALGSVISTHQGMAIPLTAIAAVAAADLLAGRNHFLAPMMVMAPALAVVTTTWKRTLLIGLLGAAVQAALVPYDGVLGTQDRRILAGITISYLAVVLFSAYGAWWREVRTEQYRAVVTVAEAAQRALLRPPGPRVGNVSLAVRYASAADAAQIGGDLYAVLDTPHGVRALVGDVRGKGLEAVQTSAVVMGAFREAAYDEGGLARVAQRVDASVRRHVLDGEFTTALFLEFPAECPAASAPPAPTAPGRHGSAASPAVGHTAPGADRTGEIALLHYGHVPPLRVSPDGRVTSLDPPEPWVPLGLTGFVSGVPEPWRVPLGPDEVLVLCTDGVIEARDPRHGGFYPLADRVGTLVAGAARDLEAAVGRLYADLLGHVGGTLGDDSVLLLLARPR